MQPTAGFMTRITCRLTAKNRGQLLRSVIEYGLPFTFYFAVPYRIVSGRSDLFNSSSDGAALLNAGRVLVQVEDRWVVVAVAYTHAEGAEPGQRRRPAVLPQRTAYRRQSKIFNVARIAEGWLGSRAASEWLACWTQAQKARVQIAAATMSGNSLRQSAHTHRASVHQAAKLVAALLMVAGVTAGLAENNGSLPPGL